MIAAVVLVAAVPCAFWIIGGGRGRLVVYCAHDAVYAEDILRRFEEAEGVRLSVVFDTEATL